MIVDAIRTKNIDDKPLLIFLEQRMDTVHNNKKNDRPESLRCHRNADKHFGHDQTYNRGQNPGVIPLKPLPPKFSVVLTEQQNILMHQKIALMLALTGLYHPHIGLPRTGDKNTIMGN